MIKIKQRQPVGQLDWPATLHPLLKRIYSNRNLHSVEEIDLSLKKLLSPDKLLGISAAVSLLQQAIQQHQHILIVGDFDADGATSTALAIRVLKALGAKPDKVDYLVPNRFEYGYGLTPGLVEHAITLKPDLIMTVDNGISSIEGVALARKHGIKVLVTDHHLPGACLPEADAIVNPNQHDDAFPSKSLAGVGVVFYLLSALRKKLRDSGWFTQQAIQQPNMADYLDIVALGTVADVVPLDRNNRILVNEGIRRIRAGRCINGITALLQVAGRNPARLIASDLGFSVGPRLNAAGRLDDMSIGIECLLADGDEAFQIAAELDQLNRQRRSIESGMQQEALMHLEAIELADADVYGLALYDQRWHQGVIGILASRIKEKMHRPVIIFAPGDDGEIKGSARSIEGIHIRDVLESLSSLNPGLIKKFGGHAMAAGLTIAEEDFARFQHLFDKQVENVSSSEILEAVVFTDGQLSADSFDLQTAALLEEAGPWGQAFPEPVFSGEFRVVSQRVLKDKHRKLSLQPVEDNDKTVVSSVFDGIAFNQLQGDETFEEVLLPEKVQLVYKLSVNEYLGQQKLQLMIEHIL